ncbi:MAG: VOC family protein [Deltaproteobacteria bacterium]|nr:VOC family protein [Deltaproteobacteria bacterium]MBW2137265.1 VOC family protein [Deltaproteobacteria bacterium]
MTNLGCDGLITFLYYEDIEEASVFYRDVMGFENVMDRDWVKIYRISGNAHVGLVTGPRGWHRPSSHKPVMLSIIVSDADKWFESLKSRDVKTDLDAPKKGSEINMKAFRLWDPEGYVIEIVEFITPYGL